MIILDTALARRAEEGRPVRVALVGAGYMARCIALQMVSSVRGMELVVIANRTPEKAETAFHEAGVPDPVRVSTTAQLEQAIAQGRPAVTDDALMMCRAEGIDAVIEATGHVEFGTQVCFESLRNGKHVILLSAEIDASVGPILKTYADSAGLVYTYTDGDEPGVGMNLYRLLDSMGYRPVLMGQLKGMLDRYRNPDTQQDFAKRYGQNPTVLASFADGSKLALEATIMGNATGFVPQVRGMKGYPLAHINDMLAEFTADDFAEEGFVEFALGAAPHTGAFVICHNDHPAKRHLMGYLKMGEGPLYMFYQPFHLPPWQIVHSVGRAVVFNDPTSTPRGAPVCDSITYAKRDLRAGERLDGMGGFTCYGLVERYDVCRRENYLPMAISLDCVLVRDIAKDEPITYDDVTLPPDRLCDRLRVEQDQRFPVQAGAPAPRDGARTAAQQREGSIRT